MFRVTAVSDDYNTLMEKWRWFGSGTTGVVISSENKYGN
jgi:hypothetical protein